MKRILKIVGGIVAVLVLAVVGLNFLISADAVRERVASRVKEQTGRELSVKGSTRLLFLPNPHIVLTDVSLTDPTGAGPAADLTVGKVEIDLNFFELLSRQVDIEKVRLVRPQLTVRLRADGNSGRRSDAGPQTKQAAAPVRRRFIAAQAGGGAPSRVIRLKHVRIEDGGVLILYDDKGTERRVEHIDAALSLPRVDDPLTANGKFDWKSKTVEFDLTLATPANLRAGRPGRLDVDLRNDAIAAKFEGTIETRPDFVAEGDLTAQTRSVPSVLAWLRDGTPSATAIGDGELSSHVTWKKDEISFSDARFALAHASGQGQAVVTLRSPRPYVRAALALDRLDLNAFVPAKSGAEAKPDLEPVARPHQAAPTKAKQAMPRSNDLFSKPSQGGDASVAEARPKPARPAPDAAPLAEAAPSQPLAPPGHAVGAPAAFDADVNLNVAQTKVAGLTIGQSTIGLVFRDGVLNATLDNMELYDGKGSGTLTLDVSKPVPAFNGEFVLEDVSAQPLLIDAGKFRMLSGKTQVQLSLNGTGATANEIRTSLAGGGSIDIQDGAIEGIDLTAMIEAIGEGEIPKLKQPPGAKTQFSELGGSFTLASGLARTTDLEMISPLLEVTAQGTVDTVLGDINILATPEIVASKKGEKGKKGKKGANGLAGLSIPLRIEGPLANPSITPEIGDLFKNGQAGKTVKQIGEILQKKFKGKPVGEAIGRLLGSVKIRPRGGNADDGLEAKKRSNQAPQAASPPQDERLEPDEEQDPELRDILR
jgi:AsmA protein